MRRASTPVLDRLPPIDDDGHLRAVIESPQGSRNKLKYLPDLRTFKVSASLPAGLAFPFDFGFIPGTRAEDGDPLDVLILMDAPAYPGVLVEIRLLGIIEAEQTDGDGDPYRNDRIVAVADGSTERGDLRRLRDLDTHLLEQIETFFETYDQLLGKHFKALGRRGPNRARSVMEAMRIGAGSTETGRR